MKNNRKIIHIDMDAFYASIEQRDNKELRGKPVIVGGSPEGRGVVATCSYEARKFGIHSAMPSKMAYVRCPHAIFIPPRFDVYQKVSLQIRDIFHRYTDIIEPLSLDEAYLDVTENKQNIEYATTIAKKIKLDIYNEIGITSSAGVSYNKFLAKVASDYQKPNGLTVITPDKAQDFIDKLPIKKFFGIGKVTGKTLKFMGVKNGYDLRHLNLIQLESIFKKKGYDIYNFARGIDNRPVQVSRERKSVGSENTFIENVNFDSDELNEYVKEVVKDVCDRLRHINKCV
ncbi:MAG: DNA polymerase IV [Paeniclostridium sordellii]|nr:DNA polymerase IV [Paeniclostridium sordellii]